VYSMKVMHSLQQLCEQHNRAPHIHAQLNCLLDRQSLSMHEHACQITIHQRAFFRKATVQTRVPSTPPNLNVGYVLTQSTSSKSGCR